MLLGQLGSHLGIKLDKINSRYIKNLNIQKLKNKSDERNTGIFQIK